VAAKAPWRYGGRPRAAVGALLQDGHVRSHVTSRGISTTEGLTNTTSLPLNRTEFFAEARRILVIPTDIWNNTASSLGLVILLDGNGDPEKPAPFNAVACSVDARWAKQSPS
jgi:hypothetical protein